MPAKLLLAWLLAAGLVGLSGCTSVRQIGSESHASIQVHGHAVEEIQQTTTVVFRAEGYGLIQSSPSLMVFERPGTRGEAIKWGDLGGGGVNMRVKVQFSELVNGSRLLRADAYAVQLSDDPFFQSESRNILLNRRPYQKLLKEIAERLRQP
jgi:hypothetical protein